MTASNLPDRYRPGRFAELVGQHGALALRDAVRDDHLCHTYLFAGPYGCGKTSAARILAAAVNCTDRRQHDGEPCGSCDACTAVRSGDINFSSYREWSAPNYGTQADIEDLRTQFAVGSPFRYTVYLIDEAHRLSYAAQDALLRDIEEPPPDSIFIFATTRPEGLQDTFRSRCLDVRFRLLATDELCPLLLRVAELEGIEMDRGRAASIAQAARGSARRALQALDASAQGIHDGAAAASEAIVAAMAIGDPARVLVESRTAAREGVLGVAQVLDLAQTFWLDCLLQDDQRDEESLLPDCLREHLDAASEVGQSRITANLRVLAEAAARLEGDSMAALQMESALVQVSSGNDADLLSSLDAKLSHVMWQLDCLDDRSES